jgi:hypothetical protein
MFHAHEHLAPTAVETLSKAVLRLRGTKDRKWNPEFVASLTKTSLDVLSSFVAFMSATDNGKAS